MKLIQMSSEQRNDFFYVIKMAHEKLNDDEFNEFIMAFITAIIRRENNRLN